MPRVRATGGGSSSASFASPVKTLQIPLNDDKEEKKAKRLKSRQAAHSSQMSQIKAAATPQRKRRSLGVGEDGPATPSQDDDDPYGVRGEHVTPMKRVPILANFEEWMKMATDNKINATNSWNFALIDYFHDMSLLKEGDGVNFQKASCTLDGCVKIYTSRVDSVATETGKLLSGLADSGNKKRKGGDAEEGEEGDEEEEGEDGQKKKKTKKKSARSAEATLVGSFDQLKLKKMELEFSVDPLFKKAAADFDEGGAKGLLMNHLSIDSTGRIVFDSSDDAADAAAEESRRDSMEPEGEPEDDKKEEEEHMPEDGPVDVAGLGARFFSNLDVLDANHICPSLKTFELGGGDGSLDLPFLKAPENWRDEHADSEKDDEHVDQTGINLNDQTAAFGLDDDDAAPLFDMPADVGFGEGGEAWARDAALNPQMRVYDVGARADAGEEVGGEEVGVFDSTSKSYGVTLQHRPGDEQENILNYFDNALQKNWAGPEHWKIARIKEATKEKVTKPRKEKEPFEIDFAPPMSQELANMLYTSAPNNSNICLPKKEWKSRSRNLLPDDKHFNSKDLLKLFLKPKAKLGARRPGATTRQPPPGMNEEIDEAYWASHNADMGAAHPDIDDAVQGDYDANFFQDDNLPMAGAMDDDDDDFADARDHFSPGADEIDPAGPTGAGIDSVTGGPTETGSFGANLVAQSRRMRPEYVQYARVAKKVDVRRLKEEMWRGIGYEKRHPQETPSSRPQIPALSIDEQSELKFTDIMNNLQHVYPRQQMQDISTSFGFICLLHLANEKGLVIENVDGWTDLTVRKDFGAIITEGDL
ncbi:Condensin complex subunit 2 [Pseudocercospora fuligena]|uniref:Condensin complex subunit 2 n=1 Tax=Pseudocercospora fuligena TaxID=685502 RepID=A0A8H6RCM0_9PEZI|nr:Condensin complex subunit 2 [Pseudocercospora fuligena]